MCGSSGQIENSSNLRVLDVVDIDWDWKLQPVCQSVVEGRFSETLVNSVIFQKLPSIRKLIVNEWDLWRYGDSKHLDPNHIPVNLRIVDCCDILPRYVLLPAPEINGFPVPCAPFQNVHKLVLREGVLEMFHIDFFSYVPTAFINLMELDLHMDFDHFNPTDEWRVGENKSWPKDVKKLLRVLTNQLPHLRTFKLSKLTEACKHITKDQEVHNERVVTRLFKLPAHVRFIKYDCVRLAYDQQQKEEGGGERRVRNGGWKMWAWKHSALLDNYDHGIEMCGRQYCACKI
jgi:hypothetical protein